MRIVFPSKTEWLHPRFDCFLYNLGCVKSKNREICIFDEHWCLHQKECAIHQKEKLIECEVCSGLPPWEWKDNFVEVEVWPRSHFDCKYFGGQKDLCPPPIIGHCLDRDGGNYIILFRAFGWRNFRVWGYVDHPIAKCRVCQKWGRIARHRLTREGGYDEYVANSICLHCIKRKNKQYAQLDQSTEVNRLIRRIQRREYAISA